MHDFFWCALSQGKGPWRRFRSLPCLRPNPHISSLAITSFSLGRRSMRLKFRRHAWLYKYMFTMSSQYHAWLGWSSQWVSANQILRLVCLWRRNWRRTSMTRKQRSVGLMIMVPMLGIHKFGDLGKTWLTWLELMVSRLMNGIDGPLAELKLLNTQLIDSQAQAMVKSPEQSASKFLYVSCML